MEYTCATVPMRGVLSVWQDCLSPVAVSKAKQDPADQTNTDESYYPTAPLCRFHYLLATCLFTLKSECIISVGNCLNNKELDSAEQQKQLTPRFKPPLALFLSITGWLAEWAPAQHTHSRWGLTCTHTYLCSPVKTHNYKWTHSFYRVAYQV